MNVCQKCGAEMTENEKFCTNCGTVLKPAGNVCTNCNNVVPEDLNFCTECGTAVNANQPVAKQKSKLSKQHWIVVIICSVIAVVALVGWFMWQMGQRDAPQITSPPVETPDISIPSPDTSTLQPQQTETSTEDALQQSSEPDKDFMRMFTLGDFVIHNNDAPNQQKGWCTDGADGISTPWNARNFTTYRYLVLELGAEPKGDFQFAWYGNNNSWTQTDGFRAQGRTVVFDLTSIKGYQEYLQSSEIFIFIGYYNDSWNDMPLVDAYFARDK